MNILRVEDYDNPFASLKDLSLKDRPIFETRKRLLDLPTNVLKKILRELLVRPTHIMPGIVREKGPWASAPKLRYRYQWSEARQEEYESQNLPKTVKGQKIQVFWAASPTREEAQIIEDGYNQLTTVTKDGQEIQGFIHNRKDYGVQIIHRSTVPITAISGVAILRSCKKFERLGTTVLYEENSFLFDTRGLSPFVEPQTVVTMKHLTHKPNEIPGRCRDDGTLPNRQQINRSIDMIFEQNQEKSSKFIYQDPFTRFLTEIGRNNAPHITKIVIQGRWNWIHGTWKDTGSQAVGLHELLPIYTLILEDVCKNIHTVILHDDDQGYPQVSRLGPLGIDKDKEISESVEKLVHELPYLQNLQLGLYQFVPAGCGYDPGVPGSDISVHEQPNDEWGKALKWMGFVQQRAKSRKDAQAQYQKAIEARCVTDV
ncbi:hypothetical protein SBOR_9201 [Sclerotinia borealis F-4128]|uniref:Uncharacterized protein n=1 Tax=Sclerotinia borealis (strain F-4128) TaxID=1432307 RepID=W9C3Z4_SCLBF|nr:hypothetical protein SBOR_9201 [Sclerotinia borealis F-4128]